MIKEIQEKILSIVLNSGFNEVKILTEPIVDFNSIRQDRIINLQFEGVDFLNMNTNKATLQRLPTKSQVQDLRFSLYFYFKNLRKGYAEVYDLFSLLLKSLQGENITTNDGRISSPILIENLEFVERNSNSFLVYRSSFSIRLRTTI